MLLVGKQIATTTDNFSKMVKGSYLLVDKTLMIETFLKSADDAILITRPRRFGKTLNLSMLQHFFSAEVSGEPTKGLFDKLVIAKVDNGKFLKEHQGKYPVIFLSFKDMKELTYERTIRHFKVLIRALFRQHKRLLNSEELDEEDRTSFQAYLDGTNDTEAFQQSLLFLTTLLHKVTGKNTIVLIDEYDAPLTSAYRNNFLEELSNYLRNFFSATLKTNSNLEKGLMTGILRVSENSMLSGLNNLEVYSVLDNHYGEYFGFTETEVEELVSDQKVETELPAIRDYYNGYQIGETQIYNPWSIMHFLKKKQLAPFWLLTSNDPILKKILLESPGHIKTQFRELIQDKTIEGQIDTNLRYEDLLEKPEALWTLLLSCGYLKFIDARLSPIDGSTICQLGIPNQEIKQFYKGIFLEWLEEKIGPQSIQRLFENLN